MNAEFDECVPFERSHIFPCHPMSDAPHAAAAIDDIIFLLFTAAADDSVLLYYFVLDR